MTAAFAGVLVAPLTLTGATMGAVLGLKAFAVAIIGGLTSGMGVIVGGLILGIAETTTGFYISTGYKDVPGPGAAAAGAGSQAGRPVRQIRDQEGLSMSAIKKLLHRSSAWRRWLACPVWPQPLLHPSDR